MKTIEDLEDANNLIGCLTLKIIQDISNNKYELFLNRLKELNIEIDTNEDIGRRFKHFTLVTKDDNETIFYNFGSLNNIRIITFVTKQNPIEFNTDKFSITTNITYY